jgi:hydrogenase expression/formation protein HypC
MCLAIPGKIVTLQEAGNAIVDIGGVRKQVNVSLLPDIALGDYVIVHVGYALSRVDEQEAQRTLSLFAELDELAAAGRVQ